MTKVQKNFWTLSGLLRWVKGLLRLRRWSKPESIPPKVADIAKAELNIEDDDMPKVGDKHYSYTKKGQAAARSQARRTGQTVTNTQKKKKARKRK